MLGGEVAHRVRFQRNAAHEAQRRVESRAAFTSVLPHQPRPTIAVLTMQARLGCGRRAGLLERMGAGKSIVLGARRSDASDGRVWREIDLEEIRACDLTGKANVRDCDLVALTISAGFLFGRRDALPARSAPPGANAGAHFMHARFVDLEFVRQILAHARHDQRMRVAGNDLR